MVGIVDIAFFIAGCITVVLSLSLLIITKDFKTVIIWSFSLTVVQIALAWTEHELKWHIVAVMVFFLFVLAIMMVKIKRRINAALKRIAKIEEEEKKEKECVANKEPNPFVSDTRDHDSV
jgi:cell division protein FtsW (lipid II flippase)